MKYDDGESNARKSTTVGKHLLVKFSLPSYYSEYRVISIGFYVFDSTPFKAHLFKSGSSCSNLFVSEITPDGKTGARWVDVIMPPETIVTGYGSDLDAFFISVEYLTNNKPELGFDTDRWSLYINWNPEYFVPRSYEATPSSTWNCAYGATSLPGDLMIRALVEESIGPAQKKEAATTTIAQTASDQVSNAGLAFVVIGIGAGTAVALAGFGLVLKQGTYYCPYCRNRTARTLRHCQYCGRPLV